MVVLENIGLVEKKMYKEFKLPLIIVFITLINGLKTLTSFEKNSLQTILLVLTPLMLAACLVLLRNYSSDNKFFSSALSSMDKNGIESSKCQDSTRE